MFLILYVFLANSVVAGPMPTAEAIKTRMNQMIQKGQSLKTFYTSLRTDFGNEAIKPLLDISSDDKNSDETRWAALFALGRLAGKESLGVIKKFMTNSSWMLRDAALKTAAALDARELSPQIEQRLKDNALIVRTTAVETIGHLGLKNAAPKLVEALFDPINYNGSKGLWIHKHILQVLREFNYNQAVPRLVQLLETAHDEKLQGHLVQTLEHLTGRSFQGKTLREQVYLWKRNTVSEMTF